ncbi:hypothetical protein BDV59DRAFT_196834 [Aspergillus ambiguus]|uniref:uncharacterized protein n=1 Tax=Aspergillus ambiguus TaxID=176160 RepID=UPI003CCCB153
MEKFLPSPSEYSCSVYSEHGKDRSPDRPSTPSSFECFVTIQGGSSSAVGLLPNNIQNSKYERLTDTEEYRRAVYDASFLRAENEWLRQNRKSAVSFYEGAVEPAMESLSRGTDTIHNALTNFYLAFMAVEQVIPECEGRVAAEVGATLRELTDTFENCRDGLNILRRSMQTLDAGSLGFTSQLEKANRSYGEFFGINYDERDSEIVVPVVMMQAESEH